MNLTILSDPPARLAGEAGQSQLYNPNLQMLSECHEWLIRMGAFVVRYSDAAIGGQERKERSD